MSNQQQFSAVEIAPTSAIKRKVVNMPSPRAVRWEQKEGNMNKCHFSLKEFWDRCMEPVYDLETGELIDAKKLKENKDLEVLTFWVCKDGIGVKLENEDMEG